jgi:hypothetical protein
VSSNEFWNLIESIRTLTLAQGVDPRAKYLVRTPKLLRTWYGRPSTMVIRPIWLSALF